MDSFRAPVLLVLSGDLTARDFRQHCDTHPQWQRMVDKANVERGEIPAMDPLAAKESLALIRSLAGGDLTRVFTSHDAEAWPTWHHAPEAYR